MGPVACLLASSAIPAYLGLQFPSGYVVQLKTMVGTLLANKGESLPLREGVRRERVHGKKREGSGSALTCANQDAGSARQASHPLWGRASGGEEGTGVGEELQVANMGRLSLAGVWEVAGGNARVEGAGDGMRSGRRISFP